MNNKFKYYVAVWVILLIIFNVITFVMPAEIAGLNKFGGAFWSGYVLIMLALIGQLVCACFTLRETKLEKVFLKFPMITISYSALILSFAIGSACMVIPNLPNWVGIVLCSLIFGFNAIAAVKASAAADIVIETDAKVRKETSFIRTITVDAENLISQAKTDEAKNACKKVYEAFRYSDPMSSDGLTEIEEKISNSFEVFSAKVKSGKSCTDLAEEIVNLIGDRKRMCRAVK